MVAGWVRLPPALQVVISTYLEHMSTIKRISIKDVDGKTYHVELTNEYGQHLVGVVCGQYYASPSYWDMENALHIADSVIEFPDLFPSQQAAKDIDAAIAKLEAMIPTV